MIRTLVIQIGLFALPFLVFWLYLKTGRSVANTPVVWLAVAGLVLCAAGFLVLTQFGGAPPGSTYVPARVEDDVFVPGGFVTPEATPRP